MANDVNQVVLQGTCVMDPVLREIGAAHFPLAVYRIAVGSSRKQGETWVEGPTCFIDVEALGDWQSRDVMARLGKGVRVMVTGKLAFEEWEDKKDGTKRSKHVVKQDRCEVIQRFNRDGEAIPHMAQPDRTERSEPAGSPARGDADIPF